jgi:hypothetical protein
MYTGSSLTDAQKRSVVAGTEAVLVLFQGQEPELTEGWTEVGDSVLRNETQRAHLRVFEHPDNRVAQLVRAIAAELLGAVIPRGVPIDRRFFVSRG